MKRRTVLAAASLVAAAILAGCSATGTPAGDSSATGGGKAYRVGILEIASASVIDDTVSAFQAAVEADLADAGATVTWDLKNANGDQTLITSMSRDFASSDDDAFAVIGTPAVIALAGQIADRPIFALAMGDPVGAGLAKSLEAPGGNVTGSIDYVDPALLVDDLTKLHPGLKSIGTVYDPSNQNLQVWVAALKKALSGTSIQLVESTVAASSEVGQGARALVDRSDVVLVGPDATVIAGIDAVGATMAGASIPLYVVGGDVTVPGVVGSLGPSYPDLGTGAGHGAATILLGGDAATTPFFTPPSVDIVLNKSLSEQYGITVPASLADITTYQ